MVCSICKEGGHNASSCNGQIVTEWTEKIKRFWIYGHNNSVENDEAVKEWARTARFKMPLINRIWSNFREVSHQQQWWRLNQAYKERFIQTKFYQNRPQTVTAFKNLIANYVRPAEQEPIAEAIAEVNRLEEERRQQLRREREERRRQEQERQDRLLAERIAQRQREAVEDPNAQVRRNLLREFDRAHEVFRRAEAQAIQALKPKKTSSTIQAQMDTLETDYFINADCPICMEPQTQGNTIALDCRHTCCVGCLKRTLKPEVEHRCPSCREKITKIRFKPDITPENFNTISSHIHTLV